MNSQPIELMDLTKVSTTFPQLGMPNIRRENMIITLFDMLQTDTEMVTVEGPDGIGKTTLLAQFAQEYPDHTFSLFVRSSSRWAYDSGMLTRDLCDQIGWALRKENYKTSKDIDLVHLLGSSLFELQKRANYEREMYYFIVDGLNDIPKEDCNEAEMILKLLPFGLPRFRFLLSGPFERLKHWPPKNVGNKPFRLSGFTFEETREFFKDLIEDNDMLDTIRKVSKMVPGSLASVRRLLLSGAKVDQLLQELPKRLPELFELEWRIVEAEDVCLQQALAILAFDRRQHSIDTLSRLIKIDPTELEKKLALCNFLERHNNGREVDFVCEVFKKFAADRLSNLRRNILDLIISDLMNTPESPDALMHLPGFFHQSERYQELLNYLSPTHISFLIECSDSWVPLHQKADLGVDTALRMHRDGDLLRFGLQRTTITSMGNFEPWRSEIEAYVALGDFSAAYALVQRMVTKEDRLHLLAVIARAKKMKSLPIEVELSDQIQQLYRLIDRGNLGDRGVDIASDLLFTHSELAIELVQECIGQEGPKDRLDLALARLSFNALIENEKDIGMKSTYQALRAKVKDPKVQKFVDTISLFFGEYSAEGVIAEVEKWENPSDRIFALRAWTSTNLKRDDAAVVIEYALNTILKNTTYTANAKVYRELALPLVYLPDNNSIKTIIGRLDGLKGIIESTGPTEEYVKLQATISEAVARFDTQDAVDRLMELFFYVDAISELSVKLVSLAILARVLKEVDPDFQYEKQTGIHSAIVEGLKFLIDEILTKTADHYEAVRPAIGALALSDKGIAIEVVEKLNTAPRREAALVEVMEALAADTPSENNFNTIVAAYEKLNSIPMRTQAMLGILRGFLSQNKKLAPYISRIIELQKWVKDIPDAEDKCQAFRILLKILINHQKVIPSSSLIESLSHELGLAWEMIDLGWLKIDVGFKIVTLMAESFPSISRDFLSRTEQARNEIVLDCQGNAFSYISCVRLAIRCFGGLLKRKLHREEDFEDLDNLIARIPSTYIRILAWSEIALKFYLEDDLMNCQKIVSEKVRNVLESGLIQDIETFWGAIISAAPALYCSHDVSANQLIKELPQPYRDDAYERIASFLITKRLPTESYDHESKTSKKIEYTDFLYIHEVLCRIEVDSSIYYLLESLVDRMEKRFQNEFSNPQIADIRLKLRNLVDCKFPNPNYIKHEGYKILAEAQIARLDRSCNIWDDLAKRAREITNIADKAFVLMGIGAALPSRESSKTILLLREAKTLIPNISTIDDRCDRYEILAKLSSIIDKKMSKECLQLAWNETMPLDPSELSKARRRIIDFAHRLDPEFAASLASETDNDPGREFARSQAKDRIEILKLRERIATGKDDNFTSNQDNKKIVEVSEMLLRGLNSSRINPVHIDFTRQFIKQASQMKIQDAYLILSWVIENAVRRYSGTDQANSFLRPLYEATRLSAELAFQIAARIRSVTNLSISAARASNSTTNKLIRAGERDKALELLKEWVSNASGFIKITDPYFGLEELELIKLIRSINVTIPIFILTSRKHQHETRINQPWDDAYQSYWRMSISDCDAGEVTIVIVGKSSTGEHPIHDRWWIANNTGLRMGTSANALGMSKLSEISQIEERDVTFRLEEVDRYLSGNIHEVGVDRLKYLLFKL